MGKARNLSVLLAADGQVEDAKLDGLTSSKLSGALPAISAANLTAIPAANITGTLPAISATNLTNIPAANITGTLPAISAANLTNLPISAGTGISINGSGQISVTAVALTTVQTASSQSAHLALTTQEGDIVVRSDENKSYVRNSGTASTMADFTLLATPTDAVLSVNGNTGAITAAQIATAVEAASGSNTFTDADHTKLNAIAASANNYSHPNHSGEVTSTADGATVIADNVVDEANLKVSNSPTNGYFLSAQSGNTGGLTWATVDALPSQGSNSGKFLTTDGTNSSWATVDALPSQSSNSGKFLTTNGTAASWAVLDTDANSTSKGLYEHANSISANYSITSGNNALTAGPISINSGITVTIPSGSTWVIS